MAKNKEVGGLVTIDCDRMPDLPGDKDRLLLAASQLIVDGEDGFARGANLMEAAGDRLKVIKDFYESDRVMAHGLWKSILGKIDLLSGPYAQVREICEGKMLPWRKAQIAAKEQAQAEINVNAETIQRDLVEAARNARRGGDIRTARALEEQAGGVITDVVLPDNKPEVDNLQERMPWIAEVTNVMELISAISEGRFALTHTIVVRGEAREVPILEVNPAVISFYAKKQTNSMKIPGVIAKQDLNFAVGRRS